MERERNIEGQILGGTDTRGDMFTVGQLHRGAATQNDR